MVSLTVGFFVLFGADTVQARVNDAEAQKLNQEAILTDYLALNLDAAVTKLKKAIELCGSSGCSPNVLATVHRDLGVVYVAGMQKHDEGLQAFVRALTIDPRIALDKDLSTPEVEAAFAEAKAQVGVPATTPPPEPEPAAEPAPAAPIESSDSVKHTPPAEQALLTPIPIFVQLAAGMKPTAVRVRYLPFGASEWKAVDLTHYRTGYGGNIPCLDVGSATGDLKYYIEVVGEGDSIIAAGGSRTEPYRVAIKSDLDGDPPHLPGKPPPSQCQDSTDCPPGFPGCNSGSARSETPDEEEMQRGKPSDKATVENWILLSFQMDFMVMPSAKGACSSNAPSNYECYYGNGTQRRVGSTIAVNGVDTTFAAPGDASGKGTGEVQSGLVPATMRVLAGYDRVVADNFMLGGRLGFAFNGGPKGSASDAKSFLPVHVELDAAYWFGRKPFANAGLRPFVRLSGGLAQVDGKLTSAIVDNRDDDKNPATPPTLASTPTPTVDVWKKSGTAFVGGGGGLMYAIAPNHGPILELKGMFLMPETAAALAAQIGYQIGF